MSDPYYRTMTGFCILIDKEWVYGLYPFFRKSKRADYTFFLFMNCVWYLLKTNPCAFQFTEELLIFIMDSVYSGQFTNFLYDDSDESSVIRNDGNSIYAYISKNMQEYSNFYYITTNENIDVPENGLSVWTTYLMRYAYSSFETQLKKPPSNINDLLVVSNPNLYYFNTNYFDGCKNITKLKMSHLPIFWLPMEIAVCSNLTVIIIENVPISTVCILLLFLL